MDIMVTGDAQVRQQQQPYNLFYLADLKLFLAPRVES